MIKFGVTSLTFKHLSPEEIVSIAKNASIHGIEWGENENHVPLGDLSRAKAINALTLDSGIEVFSFGSYYKLNEPIEKFKQTLETALAVGAPIIRIWAPQSEFAEMAAHANVIGDLANKHNIMVCFEYHKNSLTETAASAKKLITDINHSNIGLYWQPNFDYSFSENLRGLKSIADYITKNIHIHNYSADIGYKNLSEIKTDLSNYFNVLLGQQKAFNIIIEFVKNASHENFLKDLQTLHEIFSDLKNT